jgi:prolyl oligopeptidase
MRKDTVLNGQNPTILYGYGAYGTTEEPSRSNNVMTWVERGGIYVFAHVRGGGALGSQWHEAGQKTTKFNTWKDGIATAEWLIANGYTSSAKLGIYGGSAGGIFVGRAMTERPDLFAAAIPSVPVLDMVRSEQRANGVANVPEYGTVKVEAEFHALLRNSAYHAIQNGIRYPATMLMHGVNDSRVDVWQSLKYASRLADAQKGRQAVLLRLDYEAGHGAGSGSDQANQRTADLQAFLLWQMGVPEFQPQ